MGQQISTIFLSMALIAIITEFSKCQQTIFHWIAFIYFILNNIRYLYGDIRWCEVEGTIRKDSLGVERAIDVHLYIITRLLIVVLALQIKSLNCFMWVFCGGQLFGAIYLLFSAKTIFDKEKDDGDQKLFPIIYHWLCYNLLEVFVAFITALILTTEKDLYLLLPSLKSIDLYTWTLSVSFSLLFFIQITDWIMHHKFLFNPDLGSNVSTRKPNTGIAQPGA